MNYTIEVNYNPENKSCSTLEHFEKAWIHNEGLHHQLKDIEYDFIKSEVDSIFVLNKEFDIVADFNPLELDGLYRFFDENLELKHL